MNKKPIWKRWWFLLGVAIILIIILGSLSGEDKTELTSSNSKYDLEFKPEVTTSCGEGSITVNAKLNCPDGAIMQVVLMSGDLKETYSDTPVVKNGQITSNFKLENTEPKNYAGMIVFQFNAKSLPQPENVKKIYGEHGEKLKGGNTAEANFEDGSKGKNASYSFVVPFPNQEAVDQKITEAFNNFAASLVQNSNGVILAVDRPSQGFYRVMVSNSAWYLSSEGEKQYFAEELYKTFSQIGKNLDGKDTITLTIFDESMNEVASSKLLGGMKIKK